MIHIFPGIVTVECKKIWFLYDLGALAAVQHHKWLFILHVMIQPPKEAFHFTIIYILILKSAKSVGTEIQ